MDASNGNRDQPPPEFVEEFKRRRRRERWSAFLRPLITLASIVVSIGFLMFILRTCDQRVPRSEVFQQSDARPPADISPARPQP
jgi:hypothetical protein